MSEPHSTVQRLERQVANDNAEALAAARQAFEALAGRTLNLARERGYVGADPLGALAHAFSPDARLAGICVQTAELWQTFFACFRPDEANFEAKRFAEQAAPLNAQLTALPPGGWPDAELTGELLRTLAAFWDERQQAMNQRLDALIKDLGEHQQKLGGAQMQSAHQADELSRALGVLRAALIELGESLPAEPTASQLLAVLVARYRREIDSGRAALAGSDEAHRVLVRAVVAAARREEIPQLPPTDALTAQVVQQLALDRHRAHEDLRTLRSTAARLEAEHRQLRDEVADRDRRIARYELGEAPSAADEDERLALYRKAFAALDSGSDAKPFLDQVRVLERVIACPVTEAEQAVKILDRQGAELYKLVGELRAVQAVSEDPKRWRPRLLLGSRYDFKTLAGHAQAVRDAARDVAAYAAQMRWAQGVALMAKDASKLHRIFREMVSLTALWRDKLGDPPGASLSLKIDQGSSLVALPALLAGDLEAITRRKAKAATQACNDLAPVLEECLAVYRKSLERASGEALPPADPAPKREGESARVSRLAQDLVRLGGVLEANFREALPTDFASDPKDEALLKSDHLVLLALQQLDVACDVLAVLPGAPATTFAALPAGRALDKLLLAAKSRATWLEDVARYRFQPGQR